MLLLSSPSSSKIFWISDGSMVPPWSSSNKSKVIFNSSISFADNLSRGVKDYLVPVFGFGLISGT